MSFLSGHNLSKQFLGYGATNLSSGILRPKYMISSATVAGVGVINVTIAERENPAESGMPNQIQRFFPSGTILAHFFPNL